MATAGLGIHNVGDGIVGRGVLLDVARHLSADPLQGAFAIGPDELDATAAAHGIDVQAGDSVLVRTGWLGASLAAGGARFPGGEPGLRPGAPTRRCGSPC